MGKVSLASKDFKPKVGSGSEATFFKGQEGDDIKIRVLEKDFEHTYQHWHASSRKFVICCLTDGKYDSCPACDNPDEFGYASDSYKVNIYNYSTKQVEVWTFGNEVYLQLSKIISLSKKTGAKGDITDFDLIVSFEKRGAKKGLKQIVNKCEGKTKMPEAIYEKLLDKLVELSKFNKVLSPQELSNKFGLSDEEDDYEVEEKPKKKAVKKEVKEEVEDDEDFDLDEDDVVEEPPKKKGSKPVSKKEEVEEDEDFDFEDDYEVEEKPKKKVVKKEVKEEVDEDEDFEDFDFEDEE